MENKRIDTIDALRGIASLSVCWFHFTNGNENFLPAGWLKASGAYGWLGVEIFFVISGFIIPFALWRSKYQINNYLRFIYKRIIRLDPPYLVSILLVLGLNYLAFLTPGFKGAPPNYSLAQILLHLGYVNVFFGYEWVNIIYWTLALEFQYYLIIGLLFPFFISQRVWVRFGSLTLLGVLSVCFPNERFIWHWLCLFLLGIVTFQYQAKLLSRKAFLISLLILTGGVYFTLGLATAGVGLAAALAIAFVAIKNRLLKFLGDISYSLYLVHVPIGGKMINLSGRYFATMSGKVLTLIVTLGASVLAAYLLYKYVERPAQKWSAKIAYAKTKANEVRAEARESVYPLPANSEVDFKTTRI